MRKIFYFLFIAGSIHVSAQNKTAEKFASSITPQDLKAKLSVIASADMEGRETATQGQRKAAAYIEDYFKKLINIINTLKSIKKHSSLFKLYFHFVNRTCALFFKPLP